MELSTSKFGLSVRLNKVYTFDALLEATSGGRATPTPIPQNPGWLGQPMTFRIPVVTYKDSDDGGQKPVVSVVFTSLYSIQIDSTSYLLIELVTGNNGSEYWTIEKLIDRHERTGLKLSYATVVLDKEDTPTIKNKDIMMSLWGSDDVEGFLSGFFTGYSMSTLYIGSLKRDKESEKG